jgi:hypothetical protein
VKGDATGAGAVKGDATGAGAVKGEDAEAVKGDATGAGAGAGAVKGEDAEAVKGDATGAVKGDATGAGAGAVKGDATGACCSREICSIPETTASEAGAVSARLPNGSTLSTNAFTLTSSAGREDARSSLTLLRGLREELESKS